MFGPPRLFYTDRDVSDLKIKPPPIGRSFSFFVGVSLNRATKTTFQNCNSQLLLKKKKTSHENDFSSLQILVFVKNDKNRNAKVAFY